MQQRTVIQQLEAKMQSKGYSNRTRHFYRQTIESFLTFHGGRDPRFMGMQEIELFVAYRMRSDGLHTGLKQKYFEALIFFFTQVLGKALQQEYIAASRREPVGRTSARTGGRRRMVQQVMVF